MSQEIQNAKEAAHLRKGSDQGAKPRRSLEFTTSRVVGSTHGLSNREWPQPFSGSHALNFRIAGNKKGTLGCGMVAPQDDSGVVEGTFSALSLICE